MAWVLVLVVAAAAAFGLYWFQPWKLLTNTTVDEAVPVVAPPPKAEDAGASPRPGSTAPAVTSAGPSPVGNQILASGDFVSHEHQTMGTAQIVRLADGRHQLVLQDLQTSNGPDLRVWLADQPVLDGTAGWRVFDDGKWAELARLKGNRGDQVYEVPAAVDPAEFRSVAIWCRRFAVSFGAAPLTPA